MEANKMARKKTIVKKTKRFIATTPNPDFIGKRAGVRFYGGQAVISEETIDKTLGFPIEEIVFRLERDFGYQIEELVEE
jgi:hypothetical protein